MRIESKDGEATLWMYDPIGEMFGPDAITAKGVRDKLGELRNINRLVIRINSPGGEVDDATAIHTLLSEFPGEKIAKVDGVAASAATLPMVAADTIQVAAGAKVMIHNPWTIAVGDYRELAKASSVAKQYRESLADLYSARSSKEGIAIREAMDAETWFSADEAVEWGLADAVGDGGAVKASRSGEEIMAQAVLVAKLAFAKLVSGTQEEIQATMDSIGEAANRMAAKRRERVHALDRLRRSSLN